jgi:hypothetical protein
LGFEEALLLFFLCGKNCHKPTVRKLVIQRDFPPILGLPMNKMS